MSDWNIGLSTGLFYQLNFLDCLVAIQEAGFEYLEICSYPVHLNYHDPHSIELAVTAMNDLGLQAISFHAPFGDPIDITSTHEETRIHARQELMKAIDAACQLSTSYFVLHPGPERGDFPYEEKIKHTQLLLDELKILYEHCGTCGMHLALENMLPHLFTGYQRDLLWLLGALEDHHIHICFDTGHAYLGGEAHSMIPTFKEKLKLIHASDNYGHYDDHFPPGQGKIDWPQIVQQLDEHQFDGTMILELQGEQSISVGIEKAVRGKEYIEKCKLAKKDKPVTRDFY